MNATPRRLADDVLYGVYLRPDPATCWAVTSVTTALRAQYGLVSAGKFPPHITLAGSLRLHTDEDMLVASIDTHIAALQTFPVHNAGPTRHGAGIVYDVHYAADGTVNAPLSRLAAAVDRALTTLVRPGDQVTGAPVYAPDTWHAHLSLASHDLIDRTDLLDETDDYIRRLPVPVPSTFLGDTVAVYRTTSADWSGRWWETLEWTHLHSWRLAD